MSHGVLPPGMVAGLDVPEQDTTKSVRRYVRPIRPDGRQRAAFQFSRSAAHTSMRDARRAGTYDATSVTASIVSGTIARTHGSSALVSYSWLATTCRNAT